MSILDIGSKLLNQGVDLAFSAENAFFLKDFLDAATKVGAFLRSVKQRHTGTYNGATEKCV